MGGINSPIVARGEADILIGFEPMETLRAIGKVRPNGLVLTNTAPLPPFTVSIGQGTYPDLEATLDMLKAKVQQVVSFDAKARAVEAGSLQSLNMVLLGGLIGLQELPIDPEAMKATLKANTRQSFLEANLRAFDSGLEQTRSQLQ
jgi:indolepyruvate ferredoxin oxidoreductase beta subunit